MIGVFIVGNVIRASVLSEKGDRPVRVGILGLGCLGKPIARSLHNQGVDLYSWSRTPGDYPWRHTRLNGNQSNVSLDQLIIASGAAKPNDASFSKEFDSTIRLVSQLKINSSTRLIYLSSGAVYGNCDTPYSESDTPKPNTKYGEVKLHVEQHFQNEYGDRTQILRVGNLFDVNHPFGILKAIGSAAHTGNQINFFGGKNNSRDFLGGKNFADVIAKIVHQKNDYPVINVGSGKSVTLGEIAERIEKHLAGRITIQWAEKNDYDLENTMLDVALMKEICKITIDDPLEVLENYLISLQELVSDGEENK